jgi:hypothetical protein
MYNAIFTLTTKLGKVKKYPMSMSKLDEKMEKKIKVELDQWLHEANVLHAKNMVVIQAEME